MVGAFLSAHPPFQFPQGEESEARAMQSRLQHPTGDAMTAVITLSRYLAARSPVGFCKEHYLDADVMAFIVSGGVTVPPVRRDLRTPPGVASTRHIAGTP